VLENSTKHVEVGVPGRTGRRPSFPSRRFNENLALMVCSEATTPAASFSLFQGGARAGVETYV